MQSRRSAGAVSVNDAITAGGTRFDALPEPGDRYRLGECLGQGVCSEVFVATDSQAGGKRVAIKIQKMTADTVQEHRVLQQLSSHPNLPDLYGVFLKRALSSAEQDQLWLVMELCEGGPVTDLVQGLHRQGRNMAEEHIAYVLKETVKALMHLHQNHVMHRDVKGSNILLTKDGEVKLVDFGLARELTSTMAKSGTCLGSPCWMAPEMVSSSGNTSYDNRVDVWALGIVAIELGDAKPPFHNMHPTRALFQIVRNPPPTLYRPANWSTIYNDFITECLEKNPEHRPYMVELMEHPFLTAVPQNDYHLQQELRTLSEELSKEGRSNRTPEVAVREGHLQTCRTKTPELLHVEDLATLDQLSEDSLLAEIRERYQHKNCYTFVGDVLLALNPNECQPIYKIKHHLKYRFKSRSDNAPHIFTVADSAYQDALHHEEPQSIVLAGESRSGKTAQLMHLLSHLAYLGKSSNNIAEKVEKALSVVHAVGNAATPLNPNSTRHFLHLQVTYTQTGKVSGAIFWIFQLEKWRVTTLDRHQANFNAFYYFYDAMESDGCLKKYNLESGRKYNYLRVGEANTRVENAGVRENPRGNVAKFRELQQNLHDLEFDDEQQETLWNTLAAILLLGEIHFQDSGNGEAVVTNSDMVTKVAQLLAVDGKKFGWALVNYCVVTRGTATRRHHTQSEAYRARDVLASTIYSRLVDWMVNIMNWRLSFSRAVFGDPYVINLVDLFGFECFKSNSMEQLFVNTLNEQLQYHYNQRVFAWEMQEQDEEDIPVQTLQFHDNKPTLDSLMEKPGGLLYILDLSEHGSEDLLANVQRSGRNPHLAAISPKEFSVAHYTGTVTYDTHNMVAKNRDFLPPETVEVLRQSSEPTVQQLFTSRLSRTGSLIMEPPTQPSSGTAGKKGKGRWCAALMAGGQDGHHLRRYNTASRGQFSQRHAMRTASAVFRATSLEVLRSLAGRGVHFVRCVRCDVTGQPQGFQNELVRQQLRALGVLYTARARQSGFPFRVPFAEFIRRYKFLAFDFDETVEETKENSRLLLVRLKMEGWAIGKTKVFLTYYNEEYLSRLYETQVKKIVRVQTMLRAFLAKRTVQRQAKQQAANCVDSEEKAKVVDKLTEESAAIIIQKQYRGYQVRKEGPLLKQRASKLDEDTAVFIRQYCKRWKVRTIFQVLLLYRAAKHQDLVYFSQQVHLYNQQAVSVQNTCNNSVQLHLVDPAARASTELSRPKLPVRKLPFRLQDVPFFDTSPLCEPGFRAPDELELDLESWDAPLQRASSSAWLWKTHLNVRNQEVQTCSSPINELHEYHTDEASFIQTPFCRDPGSVRAMENQVSDGNPSRNTAAGRSYNHNKNAVYKAGKPRHAEVQTNNNNNIGNNNSHNYHALNGGQTTKTGPCPRSLASLQGPAPYKNQGDPNQPGSNRPLNPIMELQMKVQRPNNVVENDDPPFNFQAMLRKTNHNRASMKRPRNESEKSPSPPSSLQYNTDGDVHNSSYTRPTSTSPPPNYSGQATPNPESTVSSNSDDNSTTDQDNRIKAVETTVTELVPGLVMEGQVFDL